MCCKTDDGIDDDDNNDAAAAADYDSEWVVIVVELQ